MDSTEQNQLEYDITQAIGLYYGENNIKTLRFYSTKDTVSFSFAARIKSEYEFAIWGTMNKEDTIIDMLDKLDFIVRQRNDS